MAVAPHTRPSRLVPSKTANRQKQCRRKSTLMTKACEYSKMCDADVCLGIRLRETGQIYIFSADASGFWAFLSSQLGSLAVRERKSYIAGLVAATAVVTEALKPAGKRGTL
ncbi:uncharacterized protein N7446_004990 [Penicillium canescens]|uniref:MADS-box domain-containing protein n=1 Tax=Penicillium canescens TaxID=5083 RepID=A0AAD6I0B4_PENCN|nr:uncharacterized protein N7446_004990 [Penicillium canescens]KAJ6026408.1 hypothetical protein N7460_011225 [Penicillium canescens]KAJ6039692.1 hypothetical protein N7444_008597 [Penicillium canescens]KAJ6067953.1 hypothetical protein N7446_004990 [Penicillium canescens]